MSLESHLAAQVEGGETFFWHRLRWHAVRRWLDRGTFDLADIGAGAGHVGRYLASDFPGARFFFVEPIESLRRALVERHGAERDLGGKDRFAGVSFVTLLDVLEHQGDDLAFLRDLASKMDRDARLIVTVPALQQLWSWWDESLGHHRRYSRGQLVEVLRRAGFLPRESCYLFPELLPAAAYRRLRAPPGKPATEFPRISPVVNAALYSVSRLTYATRRLWPFGTSVMAVAVKA